jgi:cobalamin synthase
MTPKLVEALGAKAAERWTAALFGPATLFWAMGVTMWLLDHRSWNNSGERAVDWFDTLSGTEQVLVAIGALLVVTALDTFVRQFTFPVLQILEGYGLLVRLPWITAYQVRRLEEARAELAPFLQKEAPSSLSPKELDRYSTLAEFLRRSPAASAFIMPTRLGNILRAAETWPRDKYGLDAVICWPRLWLLLDDTGRSEISKARQELDEAILLFIWGALLLLVWGWVFFDPLVLLVTVVVALAICAFAYWWAKQRAKVYGDLIEATFDVRRGDLYDALRLPKPPTPSEEPKVGTTVTGYLWWRDTPVDLQFVEDKTKSDET